jgi:hypothetical protein
LSPPVGASGAFFGDEFDEGDRREQGGGGERQWEEAEVFRPGAAGKAESPRPGGRRLSKVQERSKHGSSFDHGSSADLGFDPPDNAVGGASTDGDMTPRDGIKRGAKPKNALRLSSDQESPSERRGGSDASFASPQGHGGRGSKAAERSRALMEAMDDPVLRGLNSKFNEIEGEIEETQRKILKMVNAMGSDIGTVDFSQMSRANERVERLMQMREQVNVALVHQRRLRQAPAASVSPESSPHASQADRSPQPYPQGNVRQQTFLEPVPPSHAARAGQQQPAPRRSNQGYGGGYGQQASPRVARLGGGGGGGVLGHVDRQMRDYDEQTGGGGGGGGGGLSMAEQRRMDRKMPAGSRQFVERQRAAQERRQQDKFEEIRRVQYHVGKSHRRAEDIERSQREGQSEREQKVLNRVIRNQVALENKFGAGGSRMPQAPVAHVQQRPEPKGGMWGGGGLGAGGGSLLGGRGNWGGGGGGFGGSRW